MFLEGELVMRTKPSKNCEIKTRLIMLDVSFLQGFSQLNAYYVASTLILRRCKSSLEEWNSSHWTMLKMSFFSLTKVANKFLLPFCFTTAALETLFMLIFVA